MTVRVEFAQAARAQILAAAAWWRENRLAAPELFEEDLAAALAHLESMPLLAQVFAEVEGKIVRRVRMPRTRYALYVTLDGEVATVHALWHGARGSGPPLP